LIGGERDRIGDALRDVSPSRTRKNSRYNMTNRLTMKLAVLQPISSACVAKNELPAVKAAENLSLTAPRFASPSRSSRLLAHAGKAFRTS
jgi:hypothetical protein